MKLVIAVIVIGVLCLFGGTLLVADTWSPGQPGCYLPYCWPGEFPTSVPHPTNTPVGWISPTPSITPTWTPRPPATATPIQPTWALPPPIHKTSSPTPSETPVATATPGGGASSGDKSSARPQAMPTQAKAKGLQDEHPGKGKAKGKNK